MNRTTTPKTRTYRHSAEAGLSALARLDLRAEGQRRLYELVRRMHGGRWPLFRCLGIRQIDGAIFEVVEWLRRESPRFGVVRWQPDGLGLSWRDAPSARAARQALSEVEPVRID
jgi:hypothetical protein